VSRHPYARFEGSLLSFLEHLHDSVAKPDLMQVEEGRINIDGEEFSRVDSREMINRMGLWKSTIYQIGWVVALVTVEKLVRVFSLSAGSSSLSFLFALVYSTPFILLYIPKISYTKQKALCAISYFSQL
jgi:hypothetical protein